MHVPLKTPPALVALAALLLTLLGAGRIAAHELAIDELTLFPDVALGHVRGQILFDPKLTRANNDAGFEVIAPRVVAFLRQNLEVRADGQRVPLSFRVRELWNGDGAIGGDSVMLDGDMPRGAKELRIFAGAPLRALAVSVQAVSATERADPRNALLLGGEWTPPYRFATPTDNHGWHDGDAELLAQEVPRHREGPATAAPPPSTPPATRKPASALVPGGFAPESTWRTAVRYARLGIVHIVPNGWDHVLFVAGLVLGSRKKYRALLAQLGAFTLAHTVTLGLGALGLVVLPVRIVEPLIAFSIAFVALENLLKKGEPRQRAAWAFAFGLLHGQGFASALAGAGIPRESFLTALFSFNVGVELGQLFVVAVLLLMLRWLGDADRFRRFALVPGSIAIAMVGLYWAVERLAA